MRNWGACLLKTLRGLCGGEQRWLQNGWWVQCVLGSQYSAILSMVGGLLFQEFPSILQVVSHCSCDKYV